MHKASLGAAVAALCVAAAAACALPGSAALGTPRPAGSSAHSSPARSTTALPPTSTASAAASAAASATAPATSPTPHGKSPTAPDPHPPVGGIGPHGEHVGGDQLATRSIALPAGAPAVPKDLTAAAWLVADLDTGTVLGARDPHGRYQPASIQKLLTAVTLLPSLPGNDVVTVSRRAADTEGSHAGLVAGGHYTVDQLFQGLLLVSGNDCAEALADAAGGRARTVALMNATARDLAAYDTVVETPSGLDGWRQLTSAYDMMLFLRAAVAQPRVLDYDRVTKAYLPAQPAADSGRVAMWNQNEQFLSTVPGAIAAKTGFTDAAQHTFAGAISRNGHRYGVVLLRAQRSPDDQWVQATKLVDWATTLPVGSQVGRLAAPAKRPTAAGTPSSAASGTPSVTGTTTLSLGPDARQSVRAAAAATSASKASPSASPSGTPGKSGNSSNTGVRFVFIVVLIGALFLLSTRLRRRVGGGRTPPGRTPGYGRPSRGRPGGPSDRPPGPPHHPDDRPPGPPEPRDPRELPPS